VVWVQNPSGIGLINDLRCDGEVERRERWGFRLNSSWQIEKETHVGLPLVIGIILALPGRI
jgi:hypothetical protein